MQSALLQVRQATPYQRALIEVEVAAKQLALKIVEAEEIAGALGPGPGEGEGEGEGGEEHEHEHLEHEYDSPHDENGPEGSS